MIEARHRNHTHVSLKAVLVHALAVLMVVATKAEALHLVVMLLVLTLVKNLAIHAHNAATTDLLQALLAALGIAHHVVHAALLNGNYVYSD
jgi:hypothetical protein